MKARAGAQRHRDQEAGKTGFGRPAAPGPVTLVELSEAQKLVLDCLERAGTGLTVKQLGSALSLSGTSLQGALDGLLERKLVVRLNTVIPSYGCRYPGVGVYAE
jgi:hypothetical protein